MRRLWVKEGLKLSPSKAMDLNRRFAVGIHRILRLAERASGQSSVFTELEHTDASENQEPLKEEELKEFQELRQELEEPLGHEKALIQRHNCGCDDIILGY